MALETLEWAANQARGRIHDDDVKGLRGLLADYPDLLAWRTDEEENGLLGMATGSYGDSYDPGHEEHFTRLACAEVLLDAGAFVGPSVCDGLIQARARRLMDLFLRRGLLPRTLKFLAALGDVEGIRARLETDADDLALANEAFFYACHLQHAEAAGLLLEQAIRLDVALGRRIDGGPGRSAFIQFFVANKPDVHSADSFEPWQAFIKQRVEHAMREGDLKSFVDGLRGEAWLLSDACVKFQVRLIEVAVLNDRGAFMQALFDLDPAVLHCGVQPPSQAIEFAFTYGKTHLLPMLLRIWPMPDDLPHAAGSGDLARVRCWFDGVGEATVQRVLDTALAWAVLNNHFEVAGFLIEHGADVNTNWSSHEPASILHELVWHKNYEAMQFLIDRGIDLTIRDFRWDATAEGWAGVAAKDEKMAAFLREARRKREGPQPS